MNIFLQIWGGAGYLLAKVLLSHAEGLDDDRTWRMAGWAAYLAGLPAWVVLLAAQQTWMACAVEAAGAPSFALGLVMAWKRIDNINRALDWSIKIFTYLMILLGASYSVYTFKGITTLTQVLEIGVTFGFLLGAYLLAKKNSIGWLLFAEMLICMCVIMLIQGNMILAFQQAVSLVFAIVGFVRSRQKQKRSW
ncbi:MAG: multidrug transporter [Spirochaetaceae bacterium]|jgi:hypothetical protein|nr:multidrug transporter [Spirochaetaceae bacterium]